MTREELKEIIATNITGCCPLDAESVLKAISAAGLAVVPRKCTKRMAVNAALLYDTQPNFHSMVESAIESGDVLGGGE